MNKKLLQILKKGENETTEFKTSFSDEVIISLVAFANTRGGSVYIGVSDSGITKGIHLQTETVQNLINEIKTKTAPPLIPDAEVLDYKNQKILVFYIQEYPVKPISFMGRYYKRVSNANQLMNVNEVVNMHLQTINTSWDYHTNNHFKISDISFEKVQLAIDTINVNGININDDTLSFLFKKDLLRDEKITNAAFLLFTKNDTVISTVEMGRFQTPIIIKDNERSQSDLISQVNRIIIFIEKHMNKAIVITGDAKHTQ